MPQFVRKALELFGAERLWVNPDCGLKTRGKQEAVAALSRMVEAARRLRAEYDAGIIRKRGEEDFSSKRRKE
ncbi:MAG: hypothetical protein AB1327_02825 [Bacillota bacterium]|uniref:hypothetical protein n=1 Tax=Desulforudis sp. DRI-14 TaxID=3459793 RepID=UPI003498E92C